MDDMQIEVRTDNTNNVKTQVNEAIENALEAVGIHLVSESQDALEADPRRVDTALLKNSITYALSGKSPAISSYSAISPDKSGNTPTGTYAGTAPSDPEDKQAVYIGSNVSYAAYVHEGTSKMAPNPFIKNAFEWNKNQIEDYFREHLGNI